jgi:hypothetical protein
MWTRIGFVTKAQLGEMQRRGLKAKEAVDRIFAEAKARHPQATVVMTPSTDGFSIDALPN